MSFKRLAVVILALKNLPANGRLLRRARVLLASALAFVGVKVALTKPQALWRNFEQLIIFDEVNTLLEAQVGVWCELNDTVARA